MTLKDRIHPIARLASLLIALVVTGALFQGCAPLVVGGIATGAAVAHDRRSAGAILDDQSLELKALDLLMENNPIRSRSNISATSYNYTMLLTGTADSQEIKQQYGEMVERLTGVRRVMNEIEIAPNPSFSRISEDTYITAKVKTALFGVKVRGFDPEMVKVVTSNGMVYLMGLLHQEEAEAVVQQVRSLSGVRKVVRAFEYQAN